MNRFCEQQRIRYGFNGDKIAEDERVSAGANWKILCIGLGEGLSALWGVVSFRDLQNTLGDRSTERYL